MYTFIQCYNMILRLILRLIENLKKDTTDLIHVDDVWGFCCDQFGAN